MAEKANSQSARKVKRSPAPRPRSLTLRQEQAVFDANLSAWLEDHEGKHVLIKGKTVDGFYDSRDEALTAGYGAIWHWAASREAEFDGRADLQYSECAYLMGKIRVPIGNVGPAIDPGIWISRASYVGRHDHPVSTTKTLCTRASPTSRMLSV